MEGFDLSMGEAQKHLSRALVIIDALIIVFSYILAWFIRFKTGILGVSLGGFSFTYYIEALLYIIPLMLVLNYIFNLYLPMMTQRRYKEAGNIIKANVIGALLVILILYFTKQFHFARNMIVVFFLLNVFFDGLVRNIIRSIVKKSARNERIVKNVILVGYSNSAEEFIDRVLGFPELGYQVVGILDDIIENGTQYRGVEVIGRLSALKDILPANQIDEIAITLGLNQFYRLKEIVSVCEKSGVHTKFIPDYYNVIPTKPHTEDMMGLPVVNIRYVPLSNMFNAMLKRLGDIIGSLICIVIFSPAMLVTVIGIKATSPGPLIFKQIRVGLHNREFEMYKFRSMKVQDSKTEKKGWTTKDDPRVTKFGKFIRKTSIDELPQLFNVLKGDMSLVGPRPERPQFVEKFREEIPRYMIKHQVRPGMTGWAQVNGYRGDTSIRKRIECDLYYIENWSIGFDFKILVLTAFKGFINKNAY